MEAARCAPGPRGDSAFDDETLRLRQLKLDNQRALLEKKQRKKRLEPLMVQPNPEARLRRLKPRGSEEHTPLVDPQMPRSDVILHGIDGPAAFLKPEAQDLESKPQVLSVGSPAPEEGTEGSADGESPEETAPKPDLQEILQKHGEDGAELKTGYPSSFLSLACILSGPGLFGVSTSSTLKGECLATVVVYAVV
uniref:Tubby N-terminal domain-containing protein n=1 Tax=Mus musculus TaxID=10090 RepID=Q3UQE5_MOUSE|nr:unnamed protein product [Mus musculus]